MNFELKYFVKQKKIFLIGVLVFFIFSAQFGWCKNDSQRDKNLRAGMTTSPFYGVNLNDAKMAMKMWTERLTGKYLHGYKYTMNYYENISGISEELTKNMLDIVAVLPQEYLVLERQNKVKPILMSVVNGKSYYRLVVLVREDSGIDSLSGLKGKSMIIDVGGRGDLPEKWMQFMLPDLKKSSLTEYFSDVKKVRKSSRAVLPVYFKQADGCVASTSAYKTMVQLNPDVGRKLKVIKISGKVPNLIVCVRRNVKTEIKNALREETLRLHKETGGKQVLMLLKQDRFSRFEKGLLKHICRIYKKL